MASIQERAARLNRNPTLSFHRCSGCWNCQAICTLSFPPVVSGNPDDPSLSAEPHSVILPTPHIVMLNEVKHLHCQ